MNILFLSDNFPPEVNAPAARTYEHCKEWVKKGNEVTVITCFPNYPSGRRFGGHKQGFYISENIDGIRVIRVWSYMSPNSGVIRRTLDYLSYGISAFLVALPKKFDVVIATSPQFFTAISGQLLSLLRQKPWIMEVRDLWPDSIVAVDAIRNPGILKILRSIEHTLYKRARKIVVVTDSFKNEILKKGIPDDKIVVIKNGVDDCFYPNGKRIKIANEIRAIRSLGRFTVGYVGTIGMAHGLEMILTAAEKTDEIEYVLIGNGANRDKLIEIAGKKDLKNVHFLDPVPRNQVIHFLSGLDAAVVCLKKSDLFKTVLPSKIFETAALGVPILLGVDGEARALVESYHCGLYFKPEDVNDFIEKMLMLKSSKLLQTDLKKGCIKLASDFKRESMALKMLDEISKI